MPSRTSETGDSRRSDLEDLFAMLPDSRDSGILLDSVVRLALKFFRADAAVAFLFQQGVLTPVAWVGLQPQVVGREGNLPPSGLRAYVSRFMAPGKCRHFMSSSLLDGDHSYGELAVCSSVEGRSHYDSTDRSLLTLLARRVAGALGQVQAAERFEGQRGSISRIAKALVRETGLAQVADRAVELALSDLKADAAVVWLATPVEESLTLLSASGFPPTVLDSIKSLRFDSPSLASVAAATRQTQTLERLEPDTDQILTERIMEAEGLTSIVDVPLMAQDKLVGVFGIAKKGPDQWVEDDQALVATMADLLASSLLNARLYEESERQRLLSQSLTSTLSDINEQLAAVNRESSELAEVAQRRAAELEATIANLADAVFVCDLQGRIVLINAAGLELIGVSPTGGDPRTLSDYLATAQLRYPNGEPIPNDELAITRALRGEVVRGVQEIVYDARSGRDRHIVASAAPIRDRKGRLVGAVVAQSDITRLKELDRLKDQFITVAAHEIKTPVTAIKGFAQTLLRGSAGLDDKQRKALEIIVGQSDRIDSLVRDFLELSRMRQGPSRLSLERVNLAALVGEVVERMAKGSATHSLYSTEGNAQWVNAEAAKIQEVVMNLLDNAMRYSPRGGDVEVRTVRDGENVVVSVRDEGMGIPEERQANLFERFYRAHIGTSLDYGGLGVGLYISREIIRQHGGEMWFESKEGEGSTFFFSLPLAQSSLAGEDRSGHEADPADQQH